MFFKYLNLKELQKSFSLENSERLKGIEWNYELKRILWKEKLSPREKLIILKEYKVKGIFINDNMRKYHKKYSVILFKLRGNTTRDVAPPFLNYNN